MQQGFRRLLWASYRLYYTILYYTTLHYTIHTTILYHTILYYTILLYNIMLWTCGGPSRGGGVSAEGGGGA